jgi:hypothetical protein
MSARGRNEQPAAFQGKQNIFSVLCLDSDSDSDSEKEQKQEPSVTVSKEVIEDTSCMLEEKAQEKASANTTEKAPPSPPFRVWSDTPSRFKNDHIFSSPFSRKKTHWSRPRFKEDSEGWTSIQVPGLASASASASAESDSSAAPVTDENPQTDFPSLLTRSSGGDLNASDDHQSALAWAEKVKRSLERAENGRYESKQFSDTSISFFRKA